MNEITLDEHLIKKESRIRPNKQRAKTAQILIWIVLCVNIIAIISSYLQYNLLLDMQSGIDISDKVLDANDSRERIIAILYSIVFITSVITFIQWFRRGYYNLSVRASCERVHGWAAGAWFIPIVSLYLPYNIMKEMWRKSSRLIQLSKDEEGFDGPMDSSIVGFWWTFWIIANIITNVTNQIYKASFSIDQLLSSTIADMITSLLFIPTAILAIQVIKKYSEKEEELIRIETNTNWS